jgi:CubicO group peptidase (beta-lactamase class C family)
VIEKVSGNRYGDLLRERILDPLGMKDTGLDIDGLILPKRAEGYMPGEDGLVSSSGPSMSVPWAAGSMYSTTGDLLKWEHGLFGGKVLSANSLKLMTTPGKGNYGLGLLIMKKGFCARIWEMHRLAGILKFCVSGYTRFHEGERLDEGTGLAWV